MFTGTRRRFRRNSEIRRAQQVAQEKRQYRDWLKCHELDNVMSVIAWRQQGAQPWNGTNPAVQGNASSLHVLNSGAPACHGERLMIPAGTTVNGIKLRNDSPDKWKIALGELDVGAPIVKYGQVIGTLNRRVLPGDLIHDHNLVRPTKRIEQVEDIGFTGADNSWQASIGALMNSEEGKSLIATNTFDGFLRPNGSVGCRNLIALISIVGCITSGMDQAVQEANRWLAFQHSIGRFKNVDGFVSADHNLGCSQPGSGVDKVKDLLTGLAKNPNIGGLVFVELGCQNLAMQDVLKAFGDESGDRVRSFRAQDPGNEFDRATNLLWELARIANNRDRRQPVPLKNALIGMKCGGSDGLSGLTANYFLGLYTRFLTHHLGATVVATETGEMIGCEELLIRHSKSAELAQLFLDQLAMNREYLGEFFTENPSPGNILGGLSNIFEKSLGAVNKWLPSLLVEARMYAQQATAGLGGVSLLYGPCNDEASETNLHAAGCIATLFTTGEGTDWGSSWGPTIKVASNCNLAWGKPHWIDFNAGERTIVGSSDREILYKLIRHVNDVLSGRIRTKNEFYGKGKIAPWQFGVIF